MPDEPRRTTIALAPGDTVELVREPCTCPEGAVCPDGSLFAEACPRRPHEDRGLRGLSTYPENT